MSTAFDVPIYDVVVGIHVLTQSTLSEVYRIVVRTLQHGRLKGRVSGLTPQKNKKNKSVAAAIA